MKGLRQYGRPAHGHRQVGKIAVAPSLQMDDRFGILQAPRFEHIDDFPPAAFEDVDLIEVDRVANRIAAQDVKIVVNLPQRPPQIVGFHEHASLSHRAK
ncbi:MAG: hypothetical protein KGI46_08460 [Alphaproteobacteria bacterium]|nr:hypothetical protein [Alphaproteobacteria bacterium]MDE1930750.1 hypothetical protein [Alphaproteobacteria bacterium]